MIDLTKIIQRAICREEVLKNNTPCENVHYLLGDWEYDVASINKTGYITEFEVKVSRGDFKCDHKKRKFKYYTQNIESLTPNRFNYVCPEGLMNINEIPEYAGLIYYTTEGKLVPIRKAKLMHKLKHSREKIINKFLRVLTWRSYVGVQQLTYKNNQIVNSNNRV